MQAIRHIKTLVKASREADDVDIMKRHLEEMDQILDKVLIPAPYQTGGEPKGPQ